MHGGSPGSFSFTNSIEDVEATITYLRNPVNAVVLRADPTRIILAGHSMGGMISAIVAANHSKDSYIRAVVLISAFANMAGRTPPRRPGQSTGSCHSPNRQRPRG